MLSRFKRLFTLPFYAATLVWLLPTWAHAEWPLNMTRGVTEVSREVHGLHMQMFWWCVAIGVVVFGVMFYSMFMHRKSRGAKSANFHENTLLEFIWTIIPFIILITMAIPATITLQKMYDTEDADIDILVTGYQWNWRYEYLDDDPDAEAVSFFSVMSTPLSQIYNEEEKSENYILEVDQPMVIPVGKKVRFLVTAADVIHSWWLPAFAIKRDAIPGYIHEAWARPEETGIFRGVCAELCGKDHAYMPIEVHVVEQHEYEEWMAGKRAAAAEIAEAAQQRLSFDELYSRGEAVHARACASCHQADGSGVAGAFPAIVNSPIATGPVEVHIDRVVNGGVGMPPFGEQLTPVDLAAVVTYQRNAFGNNMGDQIQPIDVVNFQQGQ